MKINSLINVQNFIAATRDSGYKNTASALAEIVDNAIEAEATKIEITLEKTDEEDEELYELVINDNGKGMDEEELNIALQFGGSTRFNSRRQFGRYGMGLPNSSLSQCRRIEIITWKNEKDIITSYLDLDEIIEKKLTRLQKVKKIINEDITKVYKTGTIVRWKKCDRLTYKYPKTLIKHIHFEIGRIFRYAIWRGVEIKINKEKIIPFDPLFIGQGNNIKGGELFGKKLKYEIKIPGNENFKSIVTVRFVELPVKEWAKMPNEVKRKNQITKCAGVSVLRSEREIDYGWYFMGEKRKENYDDWWRCELIFMPELDEAFGVTHTKQEIKETEFMKKILVPEFEQIARLLHNRVRIKFIELKKAIPNIFSKSIMERTDVYLPPIPNKGKNNLQDTIKIGTRLKGLQYEILAKEMDNDLFYDVGENERGILLKINTKHFFYEKIFLALHNKKISNTADFIKILELLIFAAARSEIMFDNKRENKTINAFKKGWSTSIKAFIS